MKRWPAERNSSHKMKWVDILFSELNEMLWFGPIQLSICEGNTCTLLVWGWIAALGKERWLNDDSFISASQAAWWKPVRQALEWVHYGGGAWLSVVLSLERRQDSGSTSLPAQIGVLPPTHTR